MARIGYGTAAVAVQAAVTGLVGLLAMRLAGAPSSALAVQAGALALGSLLAIALRFRLPTPGRVGAMAILAVCLALVLPTLFGAGMEGVRRWVSLGPITIQPASIVLPFVLLAWTATSPGLGTSILVSALSLVLALQPDAASATGLALGLLAATLVRRKASAAAIAAVACAIAAAGWSWTRPDPLPAVAFVEQVVGAAFAANAAVGAAAWVLLPCLPAPFLLAALRGRREGAGPPTAAALAGLWIGLVAANLLANYPAPILGYGASLVLGWLASLGLLAARRPQAD